MEILPEWFEKMFRERLELATQRIASSHTTEQVWSAQGRISALLDLQAEIDLVRAQAAEEEKRAAERYLKTDA